MGAEVTLVIKADNSQYIARMKEAQQASQKLHDTSIAGEKREKGILEEIDATLKHLNESKRKAFSYEEIEKYNKKIAEAKQHLDEYENAGQKVEKQTQSLSQTIGKWALGLGGAAAALTLVKNAVLATTAGLNLFNIAGAASKQVLYNLVTGAQSLGAGLTQVIAAQKELNKLRIQDKIDTYNARIEILKFNKALVDAHDQTKSVTERIKAYDDAISHKTKATQIEIKSTEDQIAAYAKILEASPGNESAMMKYIELQTKIVDLRVQEASSMKEVSSMRSGLLKKEWQDKLNLWYAEIEEQSKVDEESYRVEKEFKDKSLALDKKNRSEKEKLGVDEFKRLEKENQDKIKLAEDKVKEQTSIEKKYYQWFWDQSDKQKDKEKKDSDEARDIKIANLEAIAQAVDSASQFTMSLYDNELTKLEWQTDSQMRILDAKYKKDIISAGKNAKRKEEIEQAYNDKRYAIELELDKKRRAIARKAAIAEKIAGLFSIGINTAVAITKALPNVLLAALAAAAGLLQAGIVASKPVPQFAKGGWTGNGTYKDNTGERVAGVVHEKEFVVKRGPAYKFREVLEAINKDDRTMIFNKFNKFAPDLAGGTTVNNVVVENEGPNKRLDAVISEQRKLNAKLSNESIQSIGNVRIIRKGSNIRTVKR